MDLASIADALADDLTPLRFGDPVTHVYNPLLYARDLHHAYLKRFGKGPREVILVGMNPGPWGMVQTGVPFGEVAAVRDWMKLTGKVDAPTREHPKVSVRGLGCPRSEVSGRRLWGWARDTFKTPRRFFARFFVVNYCPLAFLEESGRNRTPDKLPAGERAAVIQHCDVALRRTVERLKPRFVIGVGRFAETRVRSALTDMDVTIGRILHPSPASPAANRGWAAQATAQLIDCGVKLPVANCGAVALG